LTRDCVACPFPVLSVQDRCPNCGRALPVNSPTGLCAVCLLRPGLDNEAISLEHPVGPGATVTLGEDVRHGSVLDPNNSSLDSSPGTLFGEIDGHTPAALSGPKGNCAAPLPVIAGRYQFLGEIGRGGMGAVNWGHDNASVLR
jgi:hypothetical protein